MNTINISLPSKLKSDAQNLVLSGYYASLSDMVRDGLREIIYRNKYDYLMDDARTDLATGQATIIKSPKDIDKYIDSLK